jgi:hypothetical protein
MSTERNHITLASEIDSFVVVEDQVCTAKIVGITNGDRMTVIADNGINIKVRIVKEAFRDKLHAEITLKTLLTDREVIKRFNAKEAERHAVA